MSAAHDIVAAETAVERKPFDVDSIRADFPALHQSVHNKRLAYLDNAATSQKPRAVLDAIRSYYEFDNANVHRGVHTLSQRATASYEGAREKVRAFINARSEKEILYTRGCTESINLVAHSYGRTFLKPGDEVIISWMEHHANIVPWQLLCEQTGAVLKAIPLNDRGELILEDYSELLNDRTKIVAIGHISNALGTINPVKKIIELAHQRRAVVLVDGAQAVPHMRVDVQELGCDFYAFSAHKMLGPTGIGILYGRSDLLEKMPPWQAGGDMIDRVTIEKTTFNDLPYKFEAGTPHIAGAVGLGAAVDYLESVGMDTIARWEKELLEYGTARLSEIPGVRIIGTAAEKASVLSFIVNGIHAHDIGTILDLEGIAVRVGHHCAQTVMQRYGVSATARASFAFYNTKEEIDRFIAALQKAIRMFGG